MKHTLAIILISFIIILAGCGNVQQKNDVETMRQDGMWIPYENKTQNIFLPYLSNWYVREFQISPNLPFAMIGFDDKEIKHTQPQEKNNGKILIQIFDGNYGAGIVEQQKGKAGLAQSSVTVANTPATKININVSGQKQIMYVLEKLGKTYVLTTDIFEDEDTAKIFEKMVEGFAFLN
jgi:hypothetical protein